MKRNGLVAKAAEVTLRRLSFRSSYYRVVLGPGKCWNIFSIICTKDTIYLNLCLQLSIMASLADELLNDFEDSGSEIDDQEQHGFLQNDAQNEQATAPTNGRSDSIPGMELDGDEEEVSDAEEELAAQHNAANLEDAPDEEETKARVEKMKLGGVSDVRNVAGLMKTLQPVLEVRVPLFFSVREISIYIFYV